MATKKEMQRVENRDCRLMLDIVHRNIDAYGMKDCGQLRNCNARIYLLYNGWYVLKSYNTIVAAIDMFGYGYDFLRLVYGYTATSSQHISKFFHDYNAVHKSVYRPV